MKLENKESYTIKLKELENTHLEIKKIKKFNGFIEIKKVMKRFGKRYHITIFMRNM